MVTGEQDDALMRRGGIPASDRIQPSQTNPTRKASYITEALDRGERDFRRDLTSSRLSRPNGAVGALVFGSTESLRAGFDVLRV